MQLSNINRHLSFTRSALEDLNDDMEFEYDMYSGSGSDEIDEF